MSKRRTIVASGLQAHPAVRAWQRFDSSRSNPDHVVVMRQKTDSAVFRLASVGATGSSVIAKRCRPDKGAIERAVYENVFPRLGTASLDYYGSVNGDEGPWLWLFLEDAGNEHLDPGSAAQRILAAQWLGDMQAGIGRDDLPDSIPTRCAASYRRCIQSIRHAVRELRARSRLDRPGIEFVDRVSSYCSVLESCWSDIETLSAGIPTVFAHNDCLPKNVLVRGKSSRPGIAIIDWGGAGWAPAGADLGLLGLPHNDSSDNEIEFQAYRNAMSERWPELGLDDLRQAANLGRLFWALKVIGRELPQLDGGWRDPRQTHARLMIYERTLLRSMSAAGHSPGQGAPA